jgi:4-hydroxyphenylpyruvate dioxygenase
MQGQHRNRRENPKTDKFESYAIDHLEWTTGDALSTMKIFKRGLGMELIAETKKETGNHTYVSYVLKTSEVKFVVTAPLLSHFKHPQDKPPNPGYDAEKASNFFRRHGVGVSAIGVSVKDVKEAYKISVENGAKGITPPLELKDENGTVLIAEILIYNEDHPTEPLRKSDTVIRFIQNANFKGHFLPGYKPVKDTDNLNYGITKIDHVVGNVYDMNKICSDIKKYFGFHTFAGFTKEEIATPWTSLNSEVLSNNNNRVLLPINESAEGKKESQILEYLKAYNGPGVQHIALKTANIFATVELIRANSSMGFEFIPTPFTYYTDKVIEQRMLEHLTEAEMKAVKDLGILIDLDDEGVLLQIFTKPLFDRPTVFVEIIQRKCKGQTIEIPGCGGFGKGNFKALFESIERLQELRGGLLPAKE